MSSVIGAPTDRSKPRSRAKSIVVNLGVILASVVLFLLLCEFVIFRFVIPGADFEKNAFIDDVIRYEPGTSGVYRKANEIEARFSINQNGWNSTYPSYPVDRTPGVKRVAIVGDSYVHSREVDVGESFAETLEQNLSEAGSLEVFRFGIKGAPLSQYMQMLDHEVAQFQPDLVIVLLIHNDFEQTFQPITGRYIQSFRHLNIENGVVVSEKAPLPYEPGWADLISSSATYGTLQRRYGAIGTVRSLIRSLKGENVEKQNAAHQANINVQKVGDVMGDIEVATDYAFEHFAAFAEKHDIELALMMDGHRDAIYTDEAGPDAGTVPLQLNRVSAEMAAKHDLPFLDLHPHFLADWQANRASFNFESDGHWNEYGHRLVAATLTDWLRTNGLAP